MGRVDSGASLQWGKLTMRRVDYGVELTMGRVG
jgi:hypothetical protein